MTAYDPVLGAEVFQIQPENATAAARHRLDIRSRQLARERLDDHICRLGTRPVREPVPHLDALMPLLVGLGTGARTEPREGIQIINPQAHLLPMLRHQLPSQAPGNADVTVVIDDYAEDVPTRFDRQSKHSFDGLAISAR